MKTIVGIHSFNPPQIKTVELKITPLVFHSWREDYPLREALVYRNTEAFTPADQVAVTETVSEWLLQTNVATTARVVLEAGAISDVLKALERDLNRQSSRQTAQ